MQSGLIGGLPGGLGLFPLAEVVVDAAEQQRQPSGRDQQLAVLGKGKHVYKLIRNALGDAYRMELVTRNVATQVKAPPIDRQRRVGLDVAEAERLFEVISGERLEALYVLALTTGLRRGELLALRWDDINFGSRQLHVCRAMQRVGGKLQVVEPKTSSSRRTVVLPRLAVRHLQEHKKRQDVERQALGEAWREHGLVFASSIGTPVEPRNVSRRWDDLRRKAGLPWLRLQTWGTGVPRCCLRRVFRIGSLWRCSGTRRSVSR